jgi:hypothetical protein
VKDSNYTELVMASVYKIIGFLGVLLCCFLYHVENIAHANDPTTAPQPTVDLQISPDTITAGESAVLSWTSANAASVSLDNGIGTVAENGSMTVSPTATTTYTITATSMDGSPQPPTA